MQIVYVQFWNDKDNQPDGVSVHLTPLEAKHYASQKTWGIATGEPQEAQCTDRDIIRLVNESSGVRLRKYEWMKFRSKFLQEM